MNSKVFNPKYILWQLYVQLVTITKASYTFSCLHVNVTGDPVNETWTLESETGDAGSKTRYHVFKTEAFDIEIKCLVSVTEGSDNKSLVLVDSTSDSECKTLGFVSEAGTLVNVPRVFDSKSIDLVFETKGPAYETEVLVYETKVLDNKSRVLTGFFIQKPGSKFYNTGKERGLKSCSENNTLNRWLTLYILVIQTNTKQQ